MTSQNVASPSIWEICESVKRLGYGACANIRLYGEEFEVLSDPFPEAGGVAVHALAKKDSRICVLRIPATVLQSVRGKVASAA
jgi:hypothetical protein